MTREDKQAIVKQAQAEIETARLHKEGRVASWQKNEEMYYGKKKKSDNARANVDLARMQEFVHTLLSKVDDPLVFEFEKRKVSQMKRVARLNSLRDYDRDRDFWDMKDLVGKKQAIIYGRAIYTYYADSMNGYLPHLENTDVYDFLIDPNAGGIDLERAQYLGRYGVVKHRAELEEQAKPRSKTKYDREALNMLLNSSPMGQDANSKEKEYKDTRSQNMSIQRRLSQHNDPDTFVFWQWCTTFKGERYILLFTEQGGHAIHIQPLSEVFKSGLWPFWTYAMFPDLTEFWTPSACDYVRELFLAQSVSINQMLDNAEQINKPMKLIDASAIQDKSQLQYRKDGFIDVVGQTPANAIRIIETPAIETPIRVFQTLEAIQERSSGITAAAAGVEDTQGRATIYEGNMQNVSDRFGLFNKSYKHGQKRFARLYEYGVREHCLRKVAVEILGPEGIDLEHISKHDIFRKNDEFAVMVVSTNAEVAQSEMKKRAQSAFLSSLINNPIVNQKEVIQALGKVTGVEDEQIRRLLDTNEFGEADLMSEAARDAEDLLDGKVVTPNRRANAAYKQYLVNFMQDHMPGRHNGMEAEQFDRMVQYVSSLDEIIVGNTIRMAMEQQRKMMMSQMSAPTQPGGASGGGQAMQMPGPAQPLEDVIQQNV
jgi:hypothetical protein